MKVTGEHEFRASRDQVWDALQDPDVLAATLPGARSLEPKGEDEYAITVDIGVSPFVFVFTAFHALFFLGLTWLLGALAFSGEVEGAVTR